MAAVSSSRFDDVIEAARCFGLLKKPGGSAEGFLAACDALRRKDAKPAGELSGTADPLRCRDVRDCLEKLRQSTILVVGREPGRQGKAIETRYGAKVLPIDFKTLQEAYLKADRDQAADWAGRWMRNAEKVVEPSADEIRKSGAMYLAMLALMKQHNAQAITVNCLEGFYGGHIEAYPCLGFSQLNNDGLVGGCEADILSTFTMLTVGYLTGRPGFISDPVIDTSKYQIVYPHCVAPTKVFGPSGTANAYRIRTHAEDHKGAAMQSLLPAGYVLTTLKMNPALQEVVLHQAKSVGNVDDEKACRTKLAADLHGDIEKLMNHWFRWDESWHRVTFYGDVKGPVKQLGEAMGMTVIEEA